MKPLHLFHACLALVLAGISAQAQFTLDIRPVAPGTGKLRFTLDSGYYYCLESSGDLTGSFAPASGWMFGSGNEMAWTIHYPTSPASSGGESGATSGYAFTLYPFPSPNNGKTLVTWTDSSETRFRVLVAANYSTLPPLVIVPGNGTTPAVLLLVGGLEWNDAYTAFDPVLLPAAQHAVLAHLPTRV